MLGGKLFVAVAGIVVAVDTASFFVVEAVGVAEGSKRVDDEVVITLFLIAVGVVVIPMSKFFRFLHPFEFMAFIREIGGWKEGRRGGRRFMSCEKFPGRGKRRSLPLYSTKLKVICGVKEKREEKEKKRARRSLPRRYSGRYCVAVILIFIFPASRVTAPSIRKTTARPLIPGLTVLLLCRGGRYGGHIPKTS